MRRRSKLAVELSPIKQVELAAARLPDVVSLAQGIPSFDTPAPIKDYVKARLDEGVVSKYSLAPGLVELRELIADGLRADGMRYDADGEVLVTAGSIEAIAATLLALTEPGAEVLLPSPSYASYQQVIRMAGCQPRFVPLCEERNFDLDVAEIAQRINSRTQAIFYCNPNNPTGTIYSREQSLAMLELAEQHDLLVITDEVYKDFLYGDEPYFTPAQQPAFRHRVVRIFSFSKAYAMTGWRVGYLHSDRPLADRILKVHDSLVTCAPVVSQHAAIGALLHGGQAIADFRQAYRRRRDATLEHLDQLSHVFDYQKPAGAYFVFPRVKDTLPLCADSRQLAAELLQRAGVALVPGIAFGPTGEGHLRISFSRDDAAIDEAFVRLKRYFQQASRPAAPVSAPLERSRRPAALPAAHAPPARRVRALARQVGTAYLQRLARVYLRRRRPTVIAIAGFRGKTVLKRIIGALLRRHAATRVNPRSYNTEVGLPLAVLGLELDPRRAASVVEVVLEALVRALVDRRPLEYLVLELGTRQPGDMALLLQTVTPDRAVVTSIADQAVERGDPLSVVQQEIACLLDVLPAARLMYCADDPLLAALVDAHAPGAEPLRRDRLEPVAAPESGFYFAGASARYRLGAEIVGDSAAYALQAAILLGERLGVARSDLLAFLAEETGAAVIC